MIKSFNYYMPSRLIFGPGKLSKLATMNLPGKKALIVTTNGGSIKRYGTLDKVLTYLKENHIETVLFDKILPNPIKEHVMEGAALAKETGCDFVIGLGGGSAIDASKAIAVMSVNEGDYWDYIANGTGKGKSPNGALPIVAITTTAGTGTEADPWTVTTKTETNEKIGTGWDCTFPLVSIVDPELMVTVPSEFTAYQGMDAFYHASEGYIVDTANVASEPFSLQAVSLIAKSLPVAVADGKNIEARTDLAWANTAAGIVESLSSCASEHSIAHAIGAFHSNVPHGAALIAVSVEFFSFLVDKVPAKLAKMAEAMGENITGLSDKEGALLFIEALKKLISAIGMADLDLKKFGVKAEESHTLAENAFFAMGHLFPITPGNMTVEDTENIIRKSIEK